MGLKKSWIFKTSFWCEVSKHFKHFFLPDLTGDSVHAASIENNVNLDKALK